MRLPVSKGLEVTAPSSLRLDVKPAPDHRFLCWLVAITACFLSVGIAGMFEEEELMPILLSGTKGQDNGDKEAMQAAFVDVQAQEVAAETVAEQPVEVMEVPPPVDVTQVLEDLPELAEALVTEDVFVIPTPPRIENALRPVEPTPEKPTPKPKPAVRSAPRSAVASSSASARGATGSASTPGGNGGAGTAGMGKAKGGFTCSRPPYPSHLKSRGVQGTVRVRIQVGVSGRADSVVVTGSCGNSELDEHTASYIRRNGRAPAGYPHVATQALTYVLR